MIVGIAVWGSSIRFKNSTERWSGQSEYSAFVHYMLSLEEVDKVVMIGKHDKCYPDTKKFVPYKEGTYPKVDIAFVFQSQGAACISTIQGYRWVPATKTKPFRRTKVLEMAANYGGPVTDYLNKTGVHWIYMATDPRYVDMVKPADLTNPPKYCIGNAACEIDKWKMADEYLPWKDSRKLTYTTHFKIPVYYAGLQKLNIMNELDFKPPRVKLTRFAMVLNKILHYDYRTKQAKKWLPKGTDLYGNLEVKGFSNKFVPAEDLDIIFSRVKYTLVMPLYDHGYGKVWLTFKPYEMIRLGVIPFIHPDYDQQGRFVTMDHIQWLRVNSRDELEEKMNYLDNNPSRRKELLDELNKKIVPPQLIKDYLK